MRSCYTQPYYDCFVHKSTQKSANSSGDSESAAAHDNNVTSANDSINDNALKNDGDTKSNVAVACATSDDLAQAATSADTSKRS